MMLLGAQIMEGFSRELTKNQNQEEIGLWIWTTEGLLIRVTARDYLKTPN